MKGNIESFSENILTYAWIWNSNTQVTIMIEWTLAKERLRKGWRREKYEVSNKTKEPCNQQHKQPVEETKLMILTFQRNKRRQSQKKITAQKKTRKERRDMLPIGPFQNKEGHPKTKLCAIW